MKAATFLGNEEFFLLLLPLVYLCINRSIGLRLGALILCSDALCGLLKIAFSLPRPYWIDARVKVFATEASFGFPSSHAQVAASGWLFLAHQSKRSWTYFAATLLIALIAISRVFLGVHFLLDVAGGVLIGVAFLWVFLKIEPRFSRWFARQHLALQIGSSLLIAFLMLALFGAIRVLVVPSSAVSYANYFAQARVWDAIVARSGAIFGLGCGASWAQRCARFETVGTLPQKVLRFIVALIGVIVCYEGLALVSPHQPEIAAQIFRFIRYTLLTIWITFGAPFLLLKLNLLRSSGKVLS